MGNNQKRLYKFYPADSGIRNLLQGRLKISRLNELNDPFESNPFKLETSGDRKIWEQSKDKLWSDKGIISFSASSSNPLLWAHYSENHKGLCLGFDVIGATQVKYVSARKKMPALIDIIVNKDTAAIEEAIMTKYWHWRYENEWRLIVGVDREKIENGISFLDFSENLKLREVLIGFRSSLRPQDLRKAVGKEVLIKHTRPAFKSFRVIPSNKTSM